MQELELKFALTHDQLSALARLPAPSGFTILREDEKQLRSIYFDTPNQDLRHQHMTLRTRKKGAQFIQTVKAGGGVSAGISSTIEVECEVNSHTPQLDLIADSKLRKAIEATAQNAPISELFETRINRRAKLFGDQQGNEIEAAFDDGAAHCGKTNHPIIELELELINGEPAALFRLAEGLLGSESFAFSQQNKAAIGYALANNARMPKGPKPRMAQRLDLSPDTPANKAVAALLRDCLEQITINRLVVLNADTPKGPHQFRIGLRRLRSLLGLCRNTIGTQEELNSSAREFASIAGELRDLDVLLADIIKPAKGFLPPELCAIPLSAAISGARELTRTEVRASLQTPQINRLILQLSKLAFMLDSGPPTKKTIKSIATKALAKQWRRVTLQAENLSELTIEQRHDLRKALKKLRYACEFFAALYPPETTASFIAQMKKLQDVFGYLNDVAMSEQLVAMKLPENKRSNEVSLVIGFMAGWHKSRCETAWKQAKHQWQALRDTPRFWEA
ncbi:CYTH and CHAD domain-containing protein [Polycladidibacter hongkongensis]|uniref:CYTH and CHAD domain-containing protein n=1 Tax=Polycladidibacter hongkongensis TaxID=1647556 RepID=UPI00082E3D9C|nr:CYTH and CHAD domain-containing protein [Pseudovibrio hongkongensis]